jgi:hypothetical protein
MSNTLIQSTNQANTVPLVINTVTKEIGQGVSAINDKLDFRLFCLNGTYDPTVDLMSVAGLTVQTAYNAKLPVIPDGTNTGYYVNFQKYIEKRKGFTQFRIDSLRYSIVTPNGSGQDNPVGSSEQVDLFYMDDQSSTPIYSFSIPNEPSTAGTADVTNVLVPLASNTVLLPLISSDPSYFYLLNYSQYYSSFKLIVSISGTYLP